MNQEKIAPAIRLADAACSFMCTTEEHAKAVAALADEAIRLHDNIVEMQDLNITRLAKMESLSKELTAEAARTAEEKLRTDQMTEQHRMQCNMRMESDKLIIETRDKEDRLRVALEVIALGSSANPVIDAGDELVALGYWREDALKEDRLHNPVKADPRDARITDLEAQLSAIGAGGVEPLRKRDVEHLSSGHWRNNLNSTAQPARECLQQSAEPADPIESEGVSALDLTQDRLKEYLTYDPDTGIFTSLISGKEIGWRGWKGYVSLAVWDVTYRAHRLAWLYMTGEWPTNLIDHRDGDKSNNRFNNLRESTHSQNSANGKAKASASGLPRGVRKSTNSRMFKAEITVHNRRIHLGNFTTAEEASEVYTLASELLHGDYAYHLSRNKASAAQGANHVR